MGAAGNLGDSKHAQMKKEEGYRDEDSTHGGLVVGLSPRKKMLGSHHHVGLIEIHIGRREDKEGECTEHSHEGLDFQHLIFPKHYGRTGGNV